MQGKSSGACLLAWSALRARAAGTRLDHNAGPCGTAIEQGTTNGDGGAAEEDDQKDADTALKPVGRGAGAVAEMTRQATASETAESCQGAATARDMSMGEFVLVAANVKMRWPHIRSEWSEAAVRGSQIQEGSKAPMLALQDVSGHRDEEVQERLAMAIGITQDLQVGPMCYGEIVKGVLTRLDHCISDEATVLTKCAQAQDVLRQLLAHDVVQVQSEAVLDVAGPMLKKSPWCCELDEIDARATQQILRHCVECNEDLCDIDASLIIRRLEL